MEERVTLNKKSPTMFESDTFLPLLPSQYFEAMRKKHRSEGDKRLMLKLLEDAIDCFMKFINSPTLVGQRLFREAEEWITLKNKRWAFSFDNVCEMLDIDPDYIRRGLRKWKERKLEEIELGSGRRIPAAVRPHRQPEKHPSAPQPETNAPCESVRREGETTIGDLRTPFCIRTSGLLK